MSSMNAVNDQSRKNASAITTLLGTKGGSSRVQMMMVDAPSINTTTSSTIKNNINKKEKNNKKRKDRDDSSSSSSGESDSDSDADSNKIVAVVAENNNKNKKKKKTKIILEQEKAAAALDEIEDNSIVGSFDSGDSVEKLTNAVNFNSTEKVMTVLKGINPMNLSKFMSYFSASSGRACYTIEVVDVRGNNNKEFYEHAIYNLEDKKILSGIIGEMSSGNDDNSMADSWGCYPIADDNAMHSVELTDVLYRTLANSMLFSMENMAAAEGLDGYYWLTSYLSVLLYRLIVGHMTCKGENGTNNMKCCTLKEVITPMLDPETQGLDARKKRTNDLAGTNVVKFGSKLTKKKGDSTDEGATNLDDDIRSVIVTMHDVVGYINRLFTDGTDIEAILSEVTGYKVNKYDGISRGNNSKQMKITKKRSEEQYHEVFNLDKGAKKSYSSKKRKNTDIRSIMVDNGFNEKKATVAASSMLQLLSSNFYNLFYKDSEDVRGIFIKKSNQSIRSLFLNDIFGLIKGNITRAITDDLYKDGVAMPSIGDMDIFIGAIDKSLKSYSNNPMFEQLGLDNGYEFVRQHFIVSNANHCKKMVECFHDDNSYIRALSDNSYHDDTTLLETLARMVAVESLNNSKNLSHTFATAIQSNNLVAAVGIVPYKEYEKKTADGKMQLHPYVSKVKKLTDTLRSGGSEAVSAVPTMYKHFVGDVSYLLDNMTSSGAVSMSDNQIKKKRETEKEEPKLRQFSRTYNNMKDRCKFLFPSGLKMVLLNLHSLVAASQTPNAERFRKVCLIDSESDERGLDYNNKTLWHKTVPLKHVDDLDAFMEAFTDVLKEDLSTMHRHLLNVFRIQMNLAGYSSHYHKVYAKSLKDMDVLAAHFPTYHSSSDNANVQEVLPGNVIVKHSFKGQLCTIVNDRNDPYVQQYDSIQGFTVKSLNAFDSIDNFISYFHALLYCGLVIQSNKPVRAMESVVLTLPEVTEKMSMYHLNLYSTSTHDVVTTVKNVNKKLKKMWLTKIKDETANWHAIIKDNLFHKGTYCNVVAADDSEIESDDDSECDMDL